MKSWLSIEKRRAGGNLLAQRREMRPGGLRAAGGGELFCRHSRLERLPDIRMMVNNTAAGEQGRIAEKAAA